MNLHEILHKENLTKEEIKFLLSLKKEDEINLLFQRADEVRQRYCGDEVHLRGIIEISNYCEQNCIYCGLRYDNHYLKRYRMSPEEIVKTARTITNEGIYTVVLQSGEDSYFDTELISYIIYQIKQNVDVAITLSLGERTFDEYKTWKIAGADRYLLKHETANPRLYEAYHFKQKLSERLEHLEFLKSIGYQIGSGNLIGLPMQTIDDIADDILLCNKFDLDMAAFGPFIPSPHTPYYKQKSGDVLLTLKTIAVARLVLKNVHIPSTTALATLDKDGRKRGLQVGANVVMPDFTPIPYRENYQIYPNKIGIHDDSIVAKERLENLLQSIGRMISYKRGDSLKHTINQS
jgi:biotin synthase